MLILETKRLRLRTLTTADAAFYLRLTNEPSFLRFIPDKGIRTLDAARQALEDGPILMQHKLGHSPYVLELKSNGAPIGLCGLIKRENLPSVDIGYALFPAYWGQGYASEASVAVLDYARDTLNLPCVLAIADPNNYASSHMLIKLGFQLIDTARDESGRMTDFFRIVFPINVV